MVSDTTIQQINVTYANNHVYHATLKMDALYARVVITSWMVNAYNAHNHAQSAITPMAHAQLVLWVITSTMNTHAHPVMISNKHVYSVNQLSNVNYVMLIIT